MPGVLIDSLLPDDTNPMLKVVPADAAAQSAAAMRSFIVVRQRRPSLKVLEAATLALVFRSEIGGACRVYGQ